MTRRDRGHRALADQLVRELGAGRRPGPFLLVWRWRWELALLAAAGGLGHAVPLEVLLPAVATSVALCAVVPASAALPVCPVLVRGDPAPVAGGPA